MEQEIYKTMRGTGALNIIVGIVTIVLGIGCGVMMIIGGAKLLAGKRDVNF